MAWPALARGPTIEATLTIRPKRARSIGRSAARVARKVRGEVGVDHPLPVLVADLRREVVGAQAGVVDEHQHRAESLAGLEQARRRRRRRRRRPAARSALPPPASIRSTTSRRAVRVLAVVDPHRPAVAGQRQRRRGADPARGAGDQRAALRRHRQRPPPLDHGRAPGEAGAEGAEQDRSAVARACRRAGRPRARAGSRPPRCCRSGRSSRRRAPRAAPAARRPSEDPARWPGGRRRGRPRRARTPAASAAASVASAIRSTAWRKVSWPFIRITPLGAGGVIRSAWAPSAPSTIGPIRPSPGAPHDDRAGAVGEDGRGARGRRGR